jgi:5'(3')-deoxyribonucleotidase
MKRIAVDMDGVLADVTEEFIKWHKRETGETIKREDILGKNDRDAFPNVRQWVYTEGFFRNLEVMPDSQEILKELHRKYEIFIVSAATEFPLSLGEKVAWLNDHFDFIPWQNMVFCGSKTIIQADIMIDDYFKNLDYFPGQTLLFTATHNALADPGRHRRVHNWKEIADILL